MSTFRGTKIRRKNNASLRKDALIASIKGDINKEYAKYHSAYKKGPLDWNTTGA